jgi:ABC-type lipoprotein export system ATPase subunit
MIEKPYLIAKNYPDNASPLGVVFHIHGITKVYRMGEVEVQALRSIDLDLYEGELVVLLGPSGSGKSTLLNILGGLDLPSSGHVFFRDRDLTHASDAELTRFRRDLGTTTAIITHNAGIAAMADRVVTMRSGQITNIRCNEQKVNPSQLEW